MRTLSVAIVALLGFMFSSNVVCAQGGGGAAMGGMGGAGVGMVYPSYQNQYRNGYYQWRGYGTAEDITVDGSAIISVKPESLRLVFAVTAEGTKSEECSLQVKTAIATIREALQPMKLTGDRIVEDFIVVIPSYGWDLKRADMAAGKDTEYLKETHTGYRMQTNLHVLCNDESQALAVIDEAFKAGVTEIISFDYFHSDLDRYKREALKKALDEAKSKANILLTVFDDKPKVLNIENTTDVSYPQSQYKTLNPAPENIQEMLPYNWRNYLKIRAHRPKTTYYAGSQEYSDLGLKKPPMNPEITVRSTVTLTYGGPARTQRLGLEKLKAENPKSKD